MEKRGEKKKRIMLHLEPASPFADPALAQNENLVPAPKRIHNNAPFFKSHPHPPNLSELRAFVEHIKLANPRAVF